MQLNQININLLCTLHVLLEKQNLTEAGFALGVTQAAMSASLKKLRVLFDDELLVRMGNQLKPTEKALQLRSKVKLIVEESIQLFCSHENFDISKCDKCFTIGVGGEHSTLLFFTELFSIAQKDAPHVRFKLKPTRYLISEEELSLGELDLCIGFFPDAPLGLKCQSLITEQLIGVMRDTHPMANTPLTLESYNEIDKIYYPYLTNDPQRVGIFDKEWANDGINIKPSIEAPYLLADYLILMQSDLLLITNMTSFCVMKNLMSITAKRLPMKNVQTTFSQYWHRVYDNSKSHIWLRNTIKSICSNIKLPDELKSD